MTLIPRFLSILFLLTTAFSAYCQESKLFTLNDDRFAVEFNSTWTIKDLTDVKSQLTEMRIELSYELLEFYEQGGLRKIKASIKFPDNMEASFSSRDLDDCEGPGFRRNLKEHPFHNKR
jgi:hypothetical protein